MLLDAAPDRLHEAAVAARHIDETLDAQHVVRPDRGGEPGAERRDIGKRAGIDDETVEIVVVVFAFVLVQRRPRRKIVLGGGSEPERHRRRDPALLGRDQLDPRPQARLDLGPQLRQGGGVEKIGLVQDDEIGAEKLVGEHLFERIVVVDRRIGAALPGDRLRIVGEAPGRDRRRVDHRDDAIDRHAGADFGPGEGLDQRFRQREAGGFDDDMAGRLGPLDQPGQGRQEIVGDRAAQAAVGQLDDIARQSKSRRRSRAAARGRCRVRRTR